MGDGVRQFRAVLERGDRALGWTVVRVPFDPRGAWPNMVRLRVCGSITGPRGGMRFRASFFPRPGGEGYLLLVNRAMQEGAGVVPGAEAASAVEADLEPRPAELPEELDMLLDEAEGLRAWYDELTEYMRREIGKWVCGVKGDEARLRRAQQVAERMLSTMEAEVELPPLIEKAFRARPKARIGWMAMTPAQRRGELMAVFYYQSTEAREKRLGKMLDLAERRG